MLANPKAKKAIKNMRVILNKIYIPLFKAYFSPILNPDLEQGKLMAAVNSQK